MGTKHRALCLVLLRRLYFLSNIVIHPHSFTVSFVLNECGSIMRAGIARDLCRDFAQNLQLS